MKTLSRCVPECSCMLLVHMLLRESCQQAVQNLGKKVGVRGGGEERGRKDEGGEEVARRRIKYGRGKARRMGKWKHSEQDIRTLHFPLGLGMRLA